MKPEKPVADSEKSDDPHIPARTAIEQIFLQVEALQRQGRTPPSFLKIFIFSKNHIERYSASYKPGSNNYQEFGELIKDVGKFIEIQSVTSRISGKGDSVHSMAKEAGQEEEGPYGYLSASGKDIVIDVEKAKGAYRKAVPGLTRVNQHKVTGFVHTHEIFHRLARISGVSLSEDESENLANLFAAEAIGLETTPEEDRVLEDFAGRIKDPEARKKFEELLLFPYDSARFLLCLHELFGEDIYNIESRKIDVIPEGAQAMKSGRRATAPAARNGKPAEAGAESKQEKAGLINNALTWFRSKAGYNTSEPSGLVIQFPLEGDQFEIYKGGKKVGYLRYRIDDEMLKLDDLEINNIAEKEAVRQAVIQWFFSMAAQYAGSRGITVLAQAITDPELLDVLIDSNLMSDMRIVGMFDKDYLSISPEEWKKHSRPAYLSVTLRGRLKGNVPVPLIPVVESIHGLRLPNSSDAEFAPTAAEFLIDFLGFDLTPRQETVDNIVRNFRIK
ncbi:MAG: hypothetical protein NTW13_04620, partial [Candidatus Omnitrophica bacterium]|nr:hypothetical protein [Candidatus Omnitrophota bacterium]